MLMVVMVVMVVEADLNPLGPDQFCDSHVNDKPQILVTQDLGVRGSGDLGVWGSGGDGINDAPHCIHPMYHLNSCLLRCHDGWSCDCNWSCDQWCDWKWRREDDGTMLLPMDTYNRPPNRPSTVRVELMSSWLPLTS
jgi:hypothetical protein